MRLTKTDWNLIKFLTTQKDWRLLSQVLSALEEGWHCASVKLESKQVVFRFDK